MKIIFLILAHDQPCDVARLANLLVSACTDAVAYIHFDARASKISHNQLVNGVAGNEKVKLVKKRIGCPWGGFGLVEAPLNALHQIKDDGYEPDYVMLLSGSCLPNRPLAYLERFLEQNNGLEFIESENDNWIKNGWRSERWKYRFWFNHRSHPHAERIFFKAQRAFRITRRFPSGLSPRFGSQWWTLTWHTLQLILSDIKRNPKRLRFFRSAWIPDEMVFQSYVHALVSKEFIAGHSLTFFHFSNRGKPIVFHDDHAEYIKMLPGFFVRKISPHARELRLQCEAIGRAKEGGGEAKGFNSPYFDYEIKSIAQTRFPKPGQIFYQDQINTNSEHILRCHQKPYIVIIGHNTTTLPLLKLLPKSTFSTNVEDFSHIAEQPNSTHINFSESKIRDLHPALHLVRKRIHSQGVPVFFWSPFYSGETLLRAILNDPFALTVAVGSNVYNLNARHAESDIQTSNANLLSSSPMTSAAIRRAELEFRLSSSLNLDPWLADDEKNVSRSFCQATYGIEISTLNYLTLNHDALLEDLDRKLDANPFKSYPWFADFSQALLTYVNACHSSINAKANNVGVRK